MDWASMIDVTSLQTQILTAGGMVLAITLGLFGFKKIRGFFGGK